MQWKSVLYQLTIHPLWFMIDCLFILVNMYFSKTKDLQKCNNGHLIMKNVLKWNAYEMIKEYGIRALTKGSKHIQSLSHKHYFKLVLHVFFSSK
jgi:hypothetical protein